MSCKCPFLTIQSMNIQDGRFFCGILHCLLHPLWLAPNLMLSWCVLIMMLVSQALKSLKRNEKYKQCLFKYIMVSSQVMLTVSGEWLGNMKKNPRAFKRFHKNPKYSKRIQSIPKESKVLQNPKYSKRIQSIPKKYKRFQKNPKDSKRIQKIPKDSK